MISAVALLLLLPLFAVIAVIIKLDSPGPVFFRQTRMGSNEETFRIWKFRSMVADADLRKAHVMHLNQHVLAGEDSRMFKAANDPRVTGVGHFLRRTSLDELPQLINVLCGQMSLVGPRPLILDENEHVLDWGRTRLRLKPGITGLWQVLGRSGIPFEEMTRLDYLYVTNWSLWGDVSAHLPYASRVAPHPKRLLATWRPESPNPVSARGSEASRTASAPTRGAQLRWSCVSVDHPGRLQPESKGPQAGTRALERRPRRRGALSAMLAREWREWE